MSGDVYVCFHSYDFSENKWRDVEVNGELVPSARYGHSAVLYEVQNVIVL